MNFRGPQGPRDRPEARNKSQEFLPGSDGSGLSRWLKPPVGDSLGR